MKKIYKFLLLFTIFILLFNLINKCVFADTYNIDVNVDENEYSLIYKANDKHYLLTFSNLLVNEDKTIYRPLIEIWENTSDGATGRIFINNNEMNITSINRYSLNKSTNSWEYRDSLNGYTNMKFTTNFEITYSNFDLYDVNGDLFFQKTPQVTISGIAKVEQLPEIIMKVMTMIVPIGLTIFSMLLVILLVRLVILRVT